MILIVNAGWTLIDDEQGDVIFAQFAGDDAERCVTCELRG